MSETSHYLRFVAAALFSAALISGDLYFSVFNDLRGAMSRILVPFRAAAALPARLYQATGDYLSARETLLAENATLMEQLMQETIRLKSMDFYLRQNEELRQLLQLKRSLPGSWEAAEVLRDVSQASARRIFLDKGIAAGVVPGTAVADEQGIIGQVIRADVNTSVVGLITDPGQHISTRVRRNNLLVILRGDGSRRLAVEFVSSDADVREGDELFAAAGGLFPSGYPVAVIESLYSGITYKEGWARPLSDFSDNTFALLYFPDVSAEPPEKSSQPPGLPAEEQAN